MPCVKEYIISGTTEEIIAASIQLAFTSDASKRECINIPVSSAVFLEPVDILQHFIILFFLYTPRTIFVFPTSTTKSMTRPPIFYVCSFHIIFLNLLKTIQGLLHQIFLLFHQLLLLDLQ